LDAIDELVMVLIQIEVRLSPIVNVTFIFHYAFPLVSNKPQIAPAFPSPQGTNQKKTETARDRWFVDLLMNMIINHEIKVSQTAK
jgi:hypothetical protein